MNAKQRRYRRRAGAPVVLCLIDAVEQAALRMEETGETMSPADCRALASGLREMLAANPHWQEAARGVRAEPDSDRANF